MSLFQRTSSFDQAMDSGQVPIIRSNQSRKLIDAKATGPERSDLESWYRSLRDICEEAEGKIDSRALEDVRDEIYGFLY
jgi:hypothetical protein